MAQHWRERGYRVKFLYGPNDFSIADVCIVHVDLSVVPEAYLEFANRYPIVLNGNIRDIRKSEVSELLLTRRSHYVGRVIVKSNLNYAGWPERIAESNLVGLTVLKLKKKLRIPFAQYNRQSDYRILETIEHVPEEIWNDPNSVVERFITEKEKNHYCVHSYKFLGNSHEWVKNLSTEPIITSFNTVGRVATDSYPEILAYRKRLGMDYGKIDFCMDSGTPLVIDVNKTPGSMSGKITGAYLELLRKRAHGIDDYF